MKKKTVGLLGLAAAGAGAAGGWAALGNYLYNRVMLPQARDPEEEDVNPAQIAGQDCEASTTTAQVVHDINPVQIAGRDWARKREGFKEATIQAMAHLPRVTSVCSGSFRFGRL